jgi:hypothetical protein
MVAGERAMFVLIVVAMVILLLGYEAGNTSHQKRAKVEIPAYSCYFSLPGEACTDCLISQLTVRCGAYTPIRDKIS